MYPQLAAHYRAAYVKAGTSATASQRFEGLPGLDEHFHRKVMTVQDDTQASSAKPKQQLQTYSQSRQPQTPTFFSKLPQESNPIKHYNELSEQALILDTFIGYHLKFNELLDEVQNKKQLTTFKKENYPNFLRERVINQLDWQEFTNQFAEEIILASKNTSFHVLRVHHCKVFNNTYLQYLIANSPHLTEISLRNCKNIKDNVGPLLANCPTLEIIDLSKTEIKYITTWSGVGYVALPHLKYLILNHCKQLQNIEIICPKLERLSLENNNALSKENIVKFLEKNPQLTHLNLGKHLQINLSDILKQKLPKLISLEVTVSPENSVDTKKTLLDIRSAMPLLKTLTLHKYGLLENTLQGHTDSVERVAVLPDGNAISASHDRTLKVWDLKSGQCVMTLQGHTQSVYECRRPARRQCH